jgi:arylsulfatase A-like enzyme
MNWTSRLWDFGPYPATDEELKDHQLAQRAAAYLRDTHGKPFFLTCGFAKPHVSWHVPPKWFDLYDRDTIALPKAPPEDMDDVPVNAVTMEKRVAPTHQEVLDSGKRRDFVQAYLAAVSFVDSCVGIVADAVENGPNKENTIVILWSDHGFPLGEKQHWAKQRLWEEATRTPLIIVGPGIAPGRATDGAASLIDVFPTLIDLCGLAANEGFDGVRLALGLRRRLDVDAQQPCRARPALALHTLRGRRGGTVRSRRRPRRMAQPRLRSRARRSQTAPRAVTAGQQRPVCRDGQGAEIAGEEGED